jgi:hypothetical protein
MSKDLDLAEDLASDLNAPYNLHKIIFTFSWSVLQKIYEIVLEIIK